MSTRPDDAVDGAYAFRAAMSRLGKMQESLVLLEAQVEQLKDRLEEVSSGDEGGVVQPG